MKVLAIQVSAIIYSNCRSRNSAGYPRCHRFFLHGFLSCLYCEPREKPRFSRGFAASEKKNLVSRISTGVLSWAESKILSFQLVRVI